MISKKIPVICMILLGVLFSLSITVAFGGEELNMPDFADESLLIFPFEKSIQAMDIDIVYTKEDINLNDFNILGWEFTSNEEKDSWDTFTVIKKPSKIINDTSYALGDDKVYSLWWCLLELKYHQTRWVPGGLG